MVYKSKRTWKDIAEPCKSKGLTRRELLSQGMAAGFLSVTMYQMAMGDLIAKAAAEDLGCVQPVREPGGLLQIFSEGGPTISARFFSDQQAEMIKNTAIMAENYGLSGDGNNIVRIGPNLNVDKSSPFGFVLLQGPPGYPGGAAAWKADVLDRLAGGGHAGPFTADDGAGINTGLLAGVTPFKKSFLGKDIRLGVNNQLADWAKVLPAASVRLDNNLQPSSVAGIFTPVPGVSGLTHPKAMAGASNAVSSITTALSKLFKTSQRKAGNVTQEAMCAFKGNELLADPSRMSGWFDPASHEALKERVTLTNLGGKRQAMLGAFYQSALGTVGGVVAQFGGRDYHGQPASSVGPADVEEAEAIVLFLAACQAAGEKGSVVYLSNGHASGRKTVPFTPNMWGMAGQQVNVPVTIGDAGGFYNAGLAIFFTPSNRGMRPNTTKFTGTFAADGGVKSSSSLGSHKEAVAGLYLSALMHLKGGSSPPSDAVAAMQDVGVRATSGILVL